MSPATSVISGSRCAEKEHGVAALALMGGHDDGAAFLRLEAGYETIDVAGGDARHVAEGDQDAVAFARQGGEAGLEGGSDPVAVARAVYEGDVEAIEGGAYVVRHVAGDDDDGAGLAGESSADRVAHDGLAAEVGQELVGRAEAGRAAGGQHETRRCGGRGGRRRRSASRCSVAGAGRVTRLRACWRSP